MASRTLPAIAVPARWPVENASWRLYPPLGPVRSSISPVRKKSGVIFDPSCRRIHLRKRDAAGGDHRFLESARGGDGEGAAFDAFDEAVDLRSGKCRTGLIGAMDARVQSASARRMGSERGFSIFDF